MAITRSGIMGAILGAVSAMMLAAGPAVALAPTLVTATTPTWSAGVLKSASNSFRTGSTTTATYNTVTMMYRTTSSTISCSSSGCSASQIGSTKTYPVSSVPGGTTYVMPSLATVTANCAAQTSTSKQTRYYWTFFKVVDAAGTGVNWKVSSAALTGTYC